MRTSTFSRGRQHGSSGGGSTPAAASARHTGLVYVLHAELALPLAAAATPLLAAMRAWAGWRLPPVRTLDDPRARCVVRTPVGQWCFVEPLWQGDTLKLWEATWRTRIGPETDGASWSTRLLALPYGNATRLTIVAEAVAVTVTDRARVLAGGEGIAASPLALVRALADAVPLLVDGMRMQPRARVLSAAQIAHFVLDDLDDGARRLPILVCSPYEATATDGSAVYPMPPDTLAAAVFGYAHVVALANHAASFALSDAVGDRTLGAYWGAARIYRPGFRHDAPAPPAPVATMSLIAIATHVALMEPLFRTSDALETIRGHLARTPLPTWQVTPELQRLRDERTATLATSVLLDGGAAVSAAPLDAHRALVGELRDRLRRMERERNDLLADFEDARRASDDDTEDRAPTETPVQVLLDVADQFSDVLVVHPRAVQSASESVYEDLDALRAALTALGTLARATRAGSIGKGLRDAFAAHGVPFIPGFSESTGLRLQRQYVRTWDGVTYSCGEHLALGISYDPRHCLRVHFCLQPRLPDGRILIGHCGRHLDTKSTT